MEKIPALSLELFRITFDVSFMGSIVYFSAFRHKKKCTDFIFVVKVILQVLLPHPFSTAAKTSPSKEAASEKAILAN